MPAICAVCTFQNPDSAKSCQMCGIPIGGDAPKVCPQCTYSNIPGAAVCSMCSFQLAELAAPGLLDDPDPLRCKGCTFRNEEGATECHVCGGILEVAGEDEGDSGDESGSNSGSGGGGGVITPEVRAQTVARLSELHRGHASFLEGAFKPIAPFTKEVKMERVTYGAAKALLSANSQVRAMKDRTGSMRVEDMILSTLTQGMPLFKTMPAAQEEVIHCMQYIFSQLTQMKDQAQRDTWLVKLAKGHQACQTIQHQTIIDVFSALANVELDFERQLLKMLAQYKMSVLDQVVTIVDPSSQQGDQAPHIRSGYLLVIEAKTGIEFHAHEAAIHDKNRPVVDGSTQDKVVEKFLELFSAQDFILEFVADINEKDGFSRSFDRDKFFKWVMDLDESSGFDKHSIFYRSEHKELYSEVQPEKDWGMVPFLCPLVAHNILSLLKITNSVEESTTSIHLPSKAEGAKTPSPTPSSLPSSASSSPSTTSTTGGIFAAVSGRLFKRRK